MKLYLKFIFCFVFISGYAQADSIPTKEIKIFNTNYKEFEVVGNLIYAVTKGDSLIKIDFRAEKSRFITDKTFSICKRKNEVLGLNEDKQVFLVDKFEIIKVVDYELFKGIERKIFFTPYRIISYKDEYIIMSKSGIIYKNKLFRIPNKLSNFSVDKKRGFDEPNLMFLDNYDILWICFDNGEFGVDIVFFDLKSLKYSEYKYIYQSKPYLNENSTGYREKMKKKYPNKVKLKNGKILFKFPYNLPIHNPIKGIAQNKNGKILLVQSLMHMGLNGSLHFIEIENKYVKIFFLKDLIQYYEPFYEDAIFFNSTEEYLGGCAFNVFNDSFYFYTNNGFWRILKNENNYTKEFLFKPWINWTAGLPNALGYQMNVSKFEFISENEMVFLTTSNGIGYFNGKEVVYFR